MPTMVWDQLMPGWVKYSKPPTSVASARNRGNAKTSNSNGPHRPLNARARRMTAAARNLGFSRRVAIRNMPKAVVDAHDTELAGRKLNVTITRVNAMSARVDG